MRRYEIAGIVGALLVIASFSAFPASLGVGVGLDPTGLILFNVTSDMTLGESFGFRAELGFSTIDVAGLMLIGGLLFVHQPIEFINPFVGVGIGAAITKVGGSALTVEGEAGTKVALFGPLFAFADLRYIVRFTAYGINYGPLYEAGLAFNF